MDGVLADFNSKTLQLIGRSLDSFPDSKSGWDAMKDYPHIYSLLEPMPDAFELVEGCREYWSKRFPAEYQLGVLTAIPKIGRIPDAKLHKRAWIAKYFPDLLINFNIGPHAVHKQLHCRVGDVLIDDKELNIKQWNGMGGVGFFHKNAAETLHEMSKVL